MVNAASGAVIYPRTITEDAMQKVVRIGTVKIGKRAASVFAKIEYNDGRLSITGVEGPLPSGNCRGSCGQIIGHYSEYDARGYASLADITPAPLWDAALIRRFFDVWNLWHLNDLRAGCEHQRAIDTTRKVEVVSYKLTREAMKLRDDTRHAATRAALAGVPFEPTPEARALAELENWYSARYSPPDADSPLSGYYEVDKREMKAIGWVTMDEHPDGMLSRPCEVCGYKYGSARLKEEVPEDVIAFLVSLPDADKTPAWI